MKHRIKFYHPSGRTFVSAEYDSGDTTIEEIRDYYQDTMVETDTFVLSFKTPDGDNIVIGDQALKDGVLIIVNESGK